MSNLLQYKFPGTTGGGSISAPRPKIQGGKQLALGGGYNGARIDRAQLSRWLTAAGSPSTDIIRDLPTLRSRSRDQLRNSPVAIGAVNTTVGNVVGTGLSYMPAINAALLGLNDEQAKAWQDNARIRFNAWAGNVDCDMQRALDFYGMQDLLLRTTLESGDGFVVTPRVKRNGRTRLALQIFEADRVCNPDNKPNTDTLVEGIELDPESLEPLRYNFARKHPADTGGAGNTWTSVEARGKDTGRRNVLHLFRMLRPGQVRGVPLIAPILEPLKQLQRWSDAELNAAVISGLFATFVTMEAQAFQDLYDEDAQQLIIDSASKWSGEMESGKAVNLLPGESIESSTPGRPNPSFDPFWTAMVRQIGMALEMPFEVLVMHFQSSYSAARAALLMAWRAWRQKRDWIGKGFCQPVLELWLADEVAEGRIAAPGFFADEIIRAAWCAGSWIGDGPGSIDPVKEVTAAEKRVAMGISTKEAESIAHDGIPWEEKHKQRVRETQAEKDDGIFTLPAGTSVPTDAPPDPAEAIARLNGTLSASLSNMGEQLRALQAIASEPRTINVTTPPVTVEGHEINVNMPEGLVQLEARLATPSIGA
jgi:lambda family phage portal protein